MDILFFYTCIFIICSPFISLSEVFYMRRFTVLAVRFIIKSLNLIPVEVKNWLSWFSYCTCKNWIVTVSHVEVQYSIHVTVSDQKRHSPYYVDMIKSKRQDLIFIMSKGRNTGRSCNALEYIQDSHEL